MISTVLMSPGSTQQEYHQEYIGADRTIEVWCLEDEMGEPLPLEESGEATKEE
jgi:hypothetical protein